METTQRGWPEETPTAQSHRRVKRPCITTACTPCRKRKTKCDGTLPVCFTCRSYKTECAYDFNTDRRRRPSTAYVDALEKRVQHLEVFIREISRGTGVDYNSVLVDDVRASPQVTDISFAAPVVNHDQFRHRTDRSSSERSQAVGALSLTLAPPLHPPMSREGPSNECDNMTSLVEELSQVMSHLRVDVGGEVGFFGPSSNLNLVEDLPRAPSSHHMVNSQHGAVRLPTKNESLSAGNPSLESVHSLFDDSFRGDIDSPAYPDSDDLELESHLLSLYWTWKHPFFFLIPKALFLRDMAQYRRTRGREGTKYYSDLLLNAILAHAAPFSRRPDVRADPNDPASAGDAFFARARSHLDAECQTPHLTTVQALALLGSREAGCGRDKGIGWLYSGMSFRIALGLGLHLSCEELVKKGQMLQEEADARAMTFWGIYGYDKAWSAYLGKPESIPANLHMNIHWPEVRLETEYEPWTPYYENTICAASQQSSPAHSITTAKHITAIQENLGSVVHTLYHGKSQTLPSDYEHLVSQHYCRLLSWQRNLPSFLRISNYNLSTAPSPPSVLLMHMLYYAAMILLFRPFIAKSRSKLLTDLSKPRALCISSSNKILMLTKVYKNNYSLQNSLNLGVYSLFIASTIHLMDAATTSPPFAHPSHAHAKLNSAICFLKEISETWPSALRCLHVIHSLIDKHAVPLNGPDPRSKLVQGHNSKAFTDATSEFRSDGSQPNLPQTMSAPPDSSFGSLPHTALQPSTADPQTLLGSFPSGLNTTTIANPFEAQLTFEFPDIDIPDLSDIFLEKSDFGLGFDEANFRI